MSETDLTGEDYKVNGLHHALLESLSAGPLTSVELYDRLPEKTARFFSVAQLVTDVTSVMAVDGYLSYDSSLWTLTAKGEGMLEFLSAKYVSPISKVAGKKEYVPPSGSYNGAELKDTCLREGAYDFLALPSLYGGKSVEHRTAKSFLGADYAENTK